MTFALTASGEDAGTSSSAGSSAAASGGSNPILKVGVFEPASGDNGAGGKQEVLGIQYANQVTPTVDINGQTYDIQLKIMDNQSTTDKAITAAQSLVNAGVSVVLGSYGSGVSIAAAPTFEQAKIPAIGCSCTNPAVTELNPYYFRVCFLDPFQGSVMASFVSEQFSAKKAYILTMLGEDYDTGLGTYFTQAFKDMGGEVKSENFPEGTSDFSAYIQNAVDYGADVIFAPSATTYASLIIGQSAKSGITIPICTGDTWESSVILGAQKGTDLPVYCSTFFDENDDSGLHRAESRRIRCRTEENPRPSAELARSRLSGNGENGGSSMFDKILPYLLAGVSVGGQYALISIGYTMVYGILCLINYAHGDNIFTVASFVMVYAAATLPLSVSIPLTIVLTVILGVLVEKVAYQPLRSAPRMSVMISAIGMSYLLQNSMWYLTGGLAKQYPVLPWISHRVNVAGTTTSRVTIITPLLTILLVAGLVLLITSSCRCCGRASAWLFFPSSS